MLSSDAVGGRRRTSGGWDVEQVSRAVGRVFRKDGQHNPELGSRRGRRMLEAGSQGREPGAFARAPPG